MKQSRTAAGAGENARSVGCLGLLLGLITLYIAAGTTHGLVLFVLGALALTVVSICMAIKKKSREVWVALTIVSATFVFFGLIAANAKREQARVEQTRAAAAERQRAASEKRRRELQENKTKNFNTARKLLREGQFDQALKYFRMVQEVDPSYEGLPEGMEQAREQQLLAELRNTSDDDVEKRVWIYQQLATIRPSNTNYTRSLQRYKDAKLGSRLPAFKLKLGAPFAPFDRRGPLYRFDQCPGKLWGRWDVMFQDARAISITRNVCTPGESFTLDVAKAEARQFFPQDAVHVRKFRLQDGWPAEEYRSKTLAQTFSKDAFGACGGKRAQPGTFSFAYAPDGKTWMVALGICL